MFEQSLVPGAKENLALLSRLDILQNSYLAGGTGLALQLGHRVSVDFDFFTTQDFRPRAIASELANVGSFIEEQADKGTVLGEFEGIKFSLFIYKYPLLFPALTYNSISIADIRDIAAMKIDSIAGRGLKRDFVDLYFICQSGHSLSELLDFYQQKYENLASNSIHIKKSLIFFNDAESDPMPRMLKEAAWPQIKQFFEDQIKKLRF